MPSSRMGLAVNPAEASRCQVIFDFQSTFDLIEPTELDRTVILLNGRTVFATTRSNSRLSVHLARRPNLKRGSKG
jgi:hypothetical protein